MYRLIKVCAFQISNTVEKNAEFVRKAGKLRSKLKNIRQTAGNAELIENYVKQHSKQQIAANIAKTANYDHEFRQFINEFNKKHKDSINVLDLSSYVKNFENLSKPGLRKQDLDILQQFRKRRLQIQAEKAIKSTQKLVSRAVKYDLDSNQAYEALEKQSKLLQKAVTPDFQKEQSQEEEEMQEKAEEKNQQQDKTKPVYQGPFEINDKFMCVVIDRDSTTCVTTLNRVNTSRCIIFLANCNGLIGYARGHGKQPKEALKNAIAISKKNIIAIPIDDNLGLPKRIHKKFLDYDFQLDPCIYTNLYGHPMMAQLLAMSGMKDLRFKTTHTGKNRYGVVNVLFKALTTNVTPQMVSEKEGFKIYRHKWIKPLTRDMPNFIR